MITMITIVLSLMFLAIIVQIFINEKLHERIKKLEKEGIDANN